MSAQHQPNPDAPKTKKPRKTRTPLTPGMLRAKADEMEQRLREKAATRAQREVERATKALRKAADALADVDPDRGAKLAAIADELAS